MHRKLCGKYTTNSPQREKWLRIWIFYAAYFLKNRLKSWVKQYNKIGKIKNINGLILKASEKFNFKISMKAVVKPHPGQWKWNRVFHKQGIQMSMEKKILIEIDTKKY